MHRSWVSTSSRPLDVRRTRSTRTSSRGTSPEGFSARGHSGACRPGRREHLRLHRRGATGVDRHRSRPGRPPPRRGAARGHGLHGGTLRRRAPRRSARGRPRGRVRPGHRARRSGAAALGEPRPGRARPHPEPFPAEPRSPTSTSSACRARPPRLRGPTSRWPRGATASAASAPSPPSGVASAHAARRTSWPRWTSWPRAHRARLPSARSCWWPRTSRPTGATVRCQAGGSPPVARPWPRSPAPWPSASTAPGCSTSIPRA